MDSGSRRDRCAAAACWVVLQLLKTRMEHCHQLYIACVCVQVLQGRCLVLHLWVA